MPTLQSSYPDRIGQAFAGQIATQETCNIASKTLDLDASAVLPFGVPVKYLTDDNQVDIASAADDGVVGISVRTHSTDARENVNSYTLGEEVAIMTLGVIWVEVGKAVAAGAPAYFGVDSQTGKFTDTATDNLAIPGGYFETNAGADGDLVKLRLR